MRKVENIDSQDNAEENSEDKDILPKRKGLWVLVLSRDDKEDIILFNSRPEPKKSDFFI